MAQTDPPIKGFIAKYATARGTPTMLSLCVLCAIWLCVGCMPHAASAQGNTMNTAPAAADTITEISIERDCTGCPSGSVLVLRRDGTALLSTTGKARLGTESSVLQGRVSRDDFDRLARQALSLGFFQLNETYEDPQLQDGAWSTTRVVRGTNVVYSIGEGRTVITAGQDRVVTVFNTAKKAEPAVQPPPAPVQN